MFDRPRPIYNNFVWSLGRYSLIIILIAGGRFMQHSHTDPFSWNNFQLESIQPLELWWSMNSLNDGDHYGRVRASSGNSGKFRQNGRVCGRVSCDYSVQWLTRRVSRVLASRAESSIVPSNRKRLGNILGHLAWTRQNCTNSLELAQTRSELATKLARTRP